MLNDNLDSLKAAANKGKSILSRVPSAVIEGEMEKESPILQIIANQK